MTTKVEYRQLGKSGLRVSVPIVGAMSFGSPEWLGWPLEEEKSFDVLKAAWDRGINTIDTANIYANGESERIIGNFVRKYQIPRNEIIIATKCFGLVGKSIGDSTWARAELTDERDYVNQSGLSRAAIFNAVDASLKRLQMDYIDLLQIHRFDPKVTPEETMKALHDLVESGKVRYIGASSMRCWQFALLNDTADKNGWTKFVSMQNEYSLLYREEEREMIPYCRYHGIGVIPWAPLAGGKLARPLGTESVRTKSFNMTITLPDADISVINRVEELAKKRETTMAKVTLAWSASKITSPIVGLGSVDRVEESLIKGLELTPEEIAYLEEPYVPKPTRRI